MKDAASFIVMWSEQISDVAADGFSQPSYGAALWITAVDFVEPLARNTHLLGHLVYVRVEDAA